MKQPLTPGAGERQGLVPRFRGKKTARGTPAEWYPARPRGDAIDVRAIAVHHMRALGATLSRVDLGAIERVADLLRLARDSAGTVYLAGNGGSAATASHWANDLGKATKRSGCAPIRVMCLSDNSSWLTALANDEGYDRVFSSQLENFAEQGDVLVVISASGNSPNLVRAVEVAHECGTATVGLLGFDGGVLMDRVSECVWLSTEKGAYELVEDGHAVICHILTSCLAQDRPA
jgi:D-sedoheptulose 7-phosphate isomerase